MKLPDNLPSCAGLSRQEILQLLLKEEYGFLPPAPKALEVEIRIITIARVLTALPSSSQTPFQSRPL